MTVPGPTIVADEVPQAAHGNHFQVLAHFLATTCASVEAGKLQRRNKVHDVEAMCTSSAREDPEVRFLRFWRNPSRDCAPSQLLWVPPVER